MAWWDRLQTGSIRGIEFRFEEQELEAGRDAAVHEFAQSDEPYVEDLGRAARRFRISAYLVGDDYMEQRDRLWAVFERPSGNRNRRAGVDLVHPTLGRHVVHPIRLRVREGKGELGFCSIDMELVEAGRVLAFVAAPDSRGEAKSAAAAAQAAAEIALVEGLAAGAGAPSPATAATKSALEQLAADLRALDVFRGLEQDVAAYTAQVVGLSAAASNLATAPADLAAKVLQSIELVEVAAGDPFRALSAYEVLLTGYDPPAPNGSGAGDLAAAENVRLLRALVLAGAAAAAARVAVAAPWETQQQALAARDRLLATVDLAEEDELEVAVLDALSQLRAAIVRGVPAPDAQLPELVAFTPDGELPGLVLAYRLYDSRERELELVRRNNLALPGFVAGGVALEVLSV